MHNDRPTFDEFKKKALQNPDVKVAYDESVPAYAVKRGMIAAGLRIRQVKDRKRLH